MTDREWHAIEAKKWLDGERSHWNRVAGHDWSEAVCVLADAITAQTHATLAAVDALDAAPTPAADDERCCSFCGTSSCSRVDGPKPCCPDCSSERDHTAEQVPAATTDGPHRVAHVNEDYGWWVYERGDEEPIAKCVNEGDAREVADALNGQASWPPMRPMSELPDGHDEAVLITDSRGDFEVAVLTLRAYDDEHGRLGWWPLPPHPKQADQ